MLSTRYNHGNNEVGNVTCIHLRNKLSLGQPKFLAKIHSRSYSRLVSPFPFYPCSLYAKSSRGNSTAGNGSALRHVWSPGGGPVMCGVQLRGGEGGAPCEVLGLKRNLAPSTAALACSDRVGAKPPPDSVPTSSVSKKKDNLFYFTRAL